MANKENIRRYIKEKFSELKSSKRDFKSIFEIIHHQGERFFCEYLDKFSIKSIKYEEFSSYIKKTANYLRNNGINPNHEYVGLLMENSLNWIALFWAILMIGGKPVLLNKKLPISVNQDIAKILKIKDVISDDHVEDAFNNVFYFENINKIIPEIDELDEIKDEDWEDEIILNTTATTMNYKICVYKGADIFSAIMNAKGVLRDNKNVKEHYEGRLKLLAFLPFYHIFGLMADYFWFAIFGRTFVFLKNYSSDTIIKTIQRHKVTHVFGVPLLWNTIAKELKKKIGQLPEKKQAQAKKGIKLSYFLQKLFPNYGRRVANKMLKEIQNQVFGDSVLFCISGGGSIPKETLYLINAIGYPLYNGYGSTEMGITSVELRGNVKYRTLGAVGKPLDSLNYKIEDGELLIKGSSTCSKIIYKDGREEIINKDEWYHTGDHFKKDKKGYYYATGRKDDVFVGVDGEKINPDEIEEKVLLTSVLRYCFTTYNNELVLILQVSKQNYMVKAEQIINEVKSCLDRLKKDGYQINRVYYTFDDIANDNAIKVSRKLLERMFNNNEVKLEDFSNFSSVISDKREDLNNEISNRLKKVFAEVLGRDIKEINDDSDFFLDLGGTSLDYMALLLKIEQEFEIAISFEKKSFSTIKEFYNYLVNIK